MKLIKGILIHDRNLERVAESFFTRIFLVPEVFGKVAKVAPDAVKHYSGLPRQR